MSADVGFDCASKTEIKTALKMGCLPENIVFSNPVKFEEDIDFARKKKVLITTADSFDELLKIQKIAPEMRILWRISIKEEGSQQLATIFSNKFGDDIASIDDLKNKFQMINKMGINLEGVHFHCGSGQQGSNNFEKAVDIAKACIYYGR